jgi:hypothetical protein
VACSACCLHHEPCYHSESVKFFCASTSAVSLTITQCILICIQSIYSLTRLHYALCTCRCPSVACSHCCVGFADCSCFEASLTVVQHVVAKTSNSSRSCTLYTCKVAHCAVVSRVICHCVADAALMSTKHRHNRHKYLI